MNQPTLHCNVLAIDGCGILILGDAGSGKTSLTLGLLERAKFLNLDAHLVCDDQAFIETTDTILKATTPDTIAGKLELRGYGVLEVPHKTSSTVQLIVHLVDDKLIDRIPEPKTTKVSGIVLPMIEVPIRHEQAAVRIVFAWLEDNILSGTKNGLIVPDS